MKRLYTKWIRYMDGLGLLQRLQISTSQHETICATRLEFVVCLYKGVEKIDVYMSRSVCHTWIRTQGQKPMILLLQQHAAGEQGRDPEAVRGRAWIQIFPQGTCRLLGLGGGHSLQAAVVCHSKIC